MKKVPPEQKREYSPEIQQRLRELAQQDIYLKRAPRSTCVGQRFGRLVVIRPVGHTTGRRLLVLSHCDCGGAKIGRLDALIGGVKSCGCLEEEMKPALKERKRLGDLFASAVKRARTAERSEGNVTGATPTVTETTVDSALDMTAIKTMVAATNLFGVRLEPTLSHSGEGREPED